MWLGALGAVLLVAAAVGGIAWAVGRGGGGGGSGDASSGACTEQTFPAQQALHVPPAKMPKGFEYNSFPPTSGPHNQEPAVWNAYSEPVDQRRVIHNLEHGGIFVEYGKDVSASTVNQIIAWYRDDPNGIIVAPLPDTPEAEKLSKNIVLGAWPAEVENEGTPQQEVKSSRGLIATCSAFDEDAFSDFRDDYRGKGNERIPVEDLQAGSQ